MKPTNLILAFFCVLSGGMASARADDAIAEVSVDPASVRLQGPGALYSLLIQGKTADGRLIDLTRSARYRSLQPGTATVSESGLIRSVSDGATTIEVEVAGKQLKVAV